MPKSLLLFACFWLFLTALRAQDLKALRQEAKALQKNPMALWDYQTKAAQLEELQQSYAALLRNDSIAQARYAALQAKLEQTNQALEESQRLQQSQATKIRSAGLKYQVVVRLPNSTPGMLLLGDPSPQDPSQLTWAYAVSKEEAQNIQQAFAQSEIILCRDGIPFNAELANDFTDYINESEEAKQQIRERLNREHNNKGTEAAQARQRQTGIIQRTGRARGTDHEIFIADLLSGNISPLYPLTASLKDVFQGAEFHDIGACVDKPDDGNDNGDAPMTHDFYFNVAAKFGLKVVAHDLNESGWTSNGQPMDFIDRYNRKVAAGSKARYPFEVHAIPPVITSIEELGLSLADETPLILRATNAIDIYYDASQRDQHFRGIVETGIKRPILYIFNNQILYKPRFSSFFERIGVVGDGFTNEGNVPTSFWKTNKHTRTSLNAYFLQK
ncbi:MAG TPA: hypothetical protein DCM08_11100 [Microscillaceae bacterium]|nr:hypothetical protein [Microscillaceae bacterium]